LNIKDLKKKGICGKKRSCETDFFGLVIMSVQFIVGRSGTGKTRYCVREIVEELLKGASKQSLLLLVPEQASYQAERAILADKRVCGYHRLNVVSFDRLQFLLTGKDTSRPGLSRIGRQMIIQRILREHKGEMEVFGSSAALAGLGRRMAEAIAELHQYGKAAEDIEQLLEELGKEERNRLAFLKFTDINLIFKEYLKFIEGKFIDPDIQLLQSCRAVAGAEFVRGAKLWVDGFAGFTTSELAILVELLRVAADARIALCLDPTKINLTNPESQELEPVSVFYPTERTYAALIEVIKKSKLRLAEPVILNKPVRFSGCEQLAHIERDIFKFEPLRIPAGDSVRIISAPNARAEVQFVARQILKLVKGRNYRYRDIAVIASEIDYYQHYIRASFEDYGIPYFIDKRKSLNQHPVVELICSALKVVTGGFLHGDIFAYLKTDLVPVGRCEIDILENYCLAFGVSGSDWTSGRDWNFAGKGDERFDEELINRIRAEVSRPLLGLRDELCPVGAPARRISAEEFVRIIFEFLGALGVRKQIGRWIEEAVKSGDYTTADEHRQFYDKLLNIFDELVEVFAGYEGTVEDYFSIINSAFSQLTLAFIPPSLDQVLVGSIERSRHPDLKVVFLIGATQKQFPVPVSFAGILSDSERQECESAGFELSATMGQKLAERQYLAYIAFTRPSEFLCVTYPTVDDKGSAIPRSQFIDSLELLFEGLSEELIGREQIQIEGIHSKSELADLLCAGLGRDALLPEARGDGRLEGLLNGICSDEELAELGRGVVYSINYNNRAELDKRIVDELFGRQMRNSATRLSSFASCPYQHFARYALELEERKEFKFEPLDAGKFYHCVLDALLKKLNDLQKDFATIEKQELLELLRRQISEIVQTDSFISNFSRRGEHNAYIIRCASEYLEDCVEAVARMVRAGGFRPVSSEISFGQVEDSPATLGEYKIDLIKGRVLSLDGKIDRIDIGEIDGKKAAIVFDYKKSKNQAFFSWSEFYYGLDMQLLIYMSAVRNASDSRYKAINPVGAFYMPVEVSPGKSTIDELSEKGESFDYKAKGIFNGSFANQLDGTASGESEFYNFYVTKDGEPYGHYESRGALRAGDFENVLKFTEGKIIQLAEEIISGKIEVRPYHLSGKSPCGYCKYKPVCRFDWQINDYNFLESVNKQQVLEKITAQEQRGKGTKAQRELKRKK
jgi:ATP-dependent helicase/nuclease subunit B